MMRKVPGCSLIRCKIRKKETTLKPVPERSKTGIVVCFFVFCFLFSRGFCYAALTYLYFCFDAISLLIHKINLACQY